MIATKKLRSWKAVRFFLGGPLEQSWSYMLHCHRLSPLHVWFVQELVRLIALISSVKVLNNMIRPKSFKNFSFDFLMACRKKILIFGIFKACISKIAYTSLDNTKNEHVLTTSYQKVASENYFRDFGCIIFIKILTGLISAIIGTNTWPNQTCKFWRDKQCQWRK